MGFDEYAESLSSFAQFSQGERPTKKRIHLLVGIGLMLNYVLGVGILELPSAFARSGVILAPLLFAIAVVLVMITLLWVLEASARARGFANVFLIVRVAQLAEEDNESEQERLAPLLRRAGNAKMVSFFAIPGDEKPNSLAMDAGAFLNPRKIQLLTASATTNHGGLSSAAATTVEPLLDTPQTKDDLITRSLRFDLEFNRELTDALEWKYKSLNHGENKSFELSELLSMFCPAWTAYAYEIGLTLLCYMGMFSFSAVFANSMVSKFPVFTWGHHCTDADWTSACEHSFILWLLAFGFVVVSLSLLEVVEMVWFQMVLSAARFLLVLLLVFVSIGGIIADPVDNGSPPNSSAPFLAPSVQYWNWDGTISVFSSAIFSMLITFGVPELITPLKKAGDSHRLIIYGLLIISSFYIFVGVTTALYFGNTLHSQININFAEFRGGAPENESIPTWALVISFFVSIFPAMDVISMFPLISIALANTFHARLIRFESMSRFSGRTLRAMCRLAASIVPIAIPLFQRDLSMIIKYAVVPGVYIAFVAPSLVQLYSVKLCRAGKINPSTPYTFPGMTLPALAYMMLVVSLGFWAMIIYSLAT